MPNLDQTGPQGEGTKTGRGLGRCKNNSTQTNKNFPGFGKGQGLRQNQRNTPLRNQGKRNLSK